MGDFDADTALETLGDGRFRITLSRDWEIWGPNGGYLATCALRAAGAVAAIPRPVAFSGHFLSVAGFDAPVDLEVRTLRAGKRAESFAVSVAQGERAIFEGMLRTAAEAPGLEHDVASFPPVGKPDQLRFIQELVPGEEPTYAFWKNFDTKPVWPERFANPRETRYPPLFQEWYRFRPRAHFDDPWLDAGRALMMIDTASWIAASQPHRGEPYIAPNLDVSAWFHRPVTTDWLLIDTRCDLAEGGTMGTHARVWDAEGRVVATGGAQLLCAPAPS